MLDALLDRFRKGDRLALARLLTLASHGLVSGEVLTERQGDKETRRQGDKETDALGPTTHHSPLTTHHSPVIAITGSGGVGKSTLIGKLIDVIRKRGLTVAVLACDPQSPRTGGALLGDRFRMQGTSGLNPEARHDDGVFIRSLAAQPGQAAIARHLDIMIRLLKAFGFNVILIETVGAGQGDTAVRDLANVLVMLLQPETGDELQWEKAGLLEVADIVAIHKADLAGAEYVESQVRASLDLSDAPTATVLRVSSRTGAGIEQLWDAIVLCAEQHRQP